MLVFLSAVSYTHLDVYKRQDPAFIEAVDRYYDHLLGLLTCYQVDQGGPILMMQVENEYGSYGEDKVYLRAIRDLMKKKGVTCPLFTSDGPWRATDVYKRQAQSWDNQVDFKPLLEADPEVTSRLTQEEIDEIFNPTYYTKRVDEIFERIGLGD